MKFKLKLTVDVGAAAEQYRPRAAKSSMPDYVCDVYGCGRILLKPSLLARHKRAFHMPAGEREFAFTCTWADCSFRGTDNRNNFAQHEATHKPAVYTHPCTFWGCGYTTNYASALTRHMKIHAFAISLPYACRFCYRRFTENFNCKKHEKICTSCAA